MARPIIIILDGSKIAIGRIKLNHVKCLLSYRNLYVSKRPCCIERILYSAWIDKKRRKINYKQRMGLHGTY
jgi:hypothetical protein